MYADGGTVDGTVNNQGTIKHSNGANGNVATVFKKAVYNAWVQVYKVLH